MKIKGQRSKLLKTKLQNIVLRISSWKVSLCTSNQHENDLRPVQQISSAETRYQDGDFVSGLLEVKSQVFLIKETLRIKLQQGKCAVGLWSRCLLWCDTVLVSGAGLCCGRQLTGRCGKWTAVRGSGQDAGGADNLRYSRYSRCSSGRAPATLWAIKYRGTLQHAVHNSSSNDIVNYVIDNNNS